VSTAQQPDLCWHSGTLVRGHGVASGLAPDSPYPAGSIAMQAPLLAARGVDLSPFFAGTLNLAFADSRWRLNNADARIEELHWTELHPPETFSFWHVALRPPGAAPLQALLYWPHPETKCRHHQQADRLELLAPWIPGLSAGSTLELGVDPRRCRRIRPLRLQARLLEFFKFRVLASQEQFFATFGGWPPRQGRTEVAALRSWLAAVHPEALDLDDDELVAVLQRSAALYCDSGAGTARAPSP
jgi:hypothetical protein